jgi:membrane associated rhomboid family serine protease
MRPVYSWPEAMAHLDGQSWLTDRTPGRRVGWQTVEVSSSDTTVVRPERPAVPPIVSMMLPVLAMLTVMWVEELIDVPLDGRLNRFGIRARRIDGLDGILFSPFLHAGFAHLIANTLPFLVLGGVIAIGGSTRFLQVTVVVGLIGGAGTWLTGPSNSVTIGASGLVFGYLMYLLSRGIFARRLSYVLGSLVVFVFYGSILWGLIPSPGISWQGHLFGALGGVAAAALLHRRADQVVSSSSAAI